MSLIKKVKTKSKTPKSPIIKKAPVGKSDCTQDLILCLLPAITNLHWLHLNTCSYVEHMVLGDLYEDLQGQLDCLAEQYIEHHGKLPPYEMCKPYMCPCQLIQELKCMVADCKCEIRGINATIDVIHTALTKALYLLNLE